MIKVNEKYYIDATTQCYTLKEKTIIQDKESKNYGQPVFKDLGYYVSIENCFKGIFKTVLRQYISKEEENNLKDLVNQIRELETYLKSLKLDI